MLSNQGVANLLAEAGTPVTVLSHRGTGPRHPLITLATTDSTLTETTFGLAATPLDEAAATTVAWWRDRQLVGAR